jgi:hypothetical protein
MKKILPSVALLTVLIGCLAWDVVDFQQEMRVISTTIEDTRHGPAF